MCVCVRERDCQWGNVTGSGITFCEERRVKEGPWKLGKSVFGWLMTPVASTGREGGKSKYVYKRRERECMSQWEKVWRVFSLRRLFLCLFPFLSAAFLFIYAASLLLVALLFLLVVLNPRPFHTLFYYTAIVCTFLIFSIVFYGGCCVCVSSLSSTIFFHTWSS